MPGLVVPEKPCVLEIEPPVLVVRAARNAAHVTMVAVVLSSALITQRRT